LPAIQARKDIPIGKVEHKKDFAAQRSSWRRKIASGGVSGAPAKLPMDAELLRGLEIG